MENITKRGAAPLRMQRLPGDGALDKTGKLLPQYARFEFPFDKAAAAKGGKRFFSGHFDAYCPWRMDDPALETDPFAPDVGYTRMHYIMKEVDPLTGNRALLDGGSASTASLYRSTTPNPGMAESGHMYTSVRKYPHEPGSTLEKSMVPSQVSIQNHPSFAKYESKRVLTEPVDLNDLCDYVRQLRPRCAHDFKPMCYLLQSLMGHLLAGEMDFFSSEIRTLKNQVLELQGLLAEAGARESADKARSLITRFRDATKLAKYRSNLEDHGSYLVQLNKQMGAELDELHKQLAAYREKCAGMESQLENVAGLHKQIKDAKREKEKALNELEALRLKSESEKKTLKSILTQKDKKNAELQKKLDELTGTSDTVAKLAEVSNEAAELRRQLEEGGGIPVPDGDYALFAEGLTNEDVSLSERAEKLGKLSPPETARVIQAMGNWRQAGALLRLNSIDYVSSVLTCGVLDAQDIAQALSNLGDIDGHIYFAMLRKTDGENMSEVMRQVHPSVSGGWLANAASQAKSRLAIGEDLGAQTILDIIHTQGDVEMQLVLDSQSATTLSEVFEKMYYDNEFHNAIDAFRNLSGATRQKALAAMDDVIREELLAALNKEIEGSYTCAKCGYCAADDQGDEDGDASISTQPSVAFQKPVMEHEIFANEESRTLEHMQPPSSWMEYCEAGGRNKLLKKWEREGYKTIAPIKLRSMITAIYVSKIKSDTAMKREGKHRTPLSEFIVQWFDNNYGLKKIAKSKMVAFIYSLQGIYEEGKDLRVCQFVRLAGMYHPLPNVMCDLLIECVEIIADVLSGSGEQFRTDSEFWSTWVSGKMIPIEKKKQKVIFERLFATGADPAAVLQRMTEELEANPEHVPSYVILPDDSCSLSRLLNFSLKTVQEMNFNVHDDCVEQFRAAAGSDKVVSFEEFKVACKALRPLTVPPEGSFAFMFWRANMLNEFPCQKEIIDALQKWEEALDELGGDAATVSVDAAVESFMWHCGIFNELGKSKDGKSALQESRLRSKTQKSIKGASLC